VVTPAPRERFHIVVDAGQARTTPEEIDRSSRATRSSSIARGAPVEIVANAVTVARGVLVDVEGRAAVRVLSFAPPSRGRLNRKDPVMNHLRPAVAVGDRRGQLYGIAQPRPPGRRERGRLLVRPPISRSSRVRLGRGRTLVVVEVKEADAPGSTSSQWTALADLGSVERPWPSRMIRSGRSMPSWRAIQASRTRRGRNDHAPRPR
jgi:hypothetical protein